MNLKKLEVYLSNTLMLSFGLALAGVAIYGLLVAPKNHSPTTNIICIGIGLFIAAAPVVKYLKSKNSVSPSAAKEITQQLSVFNVIGSFFHILSKITLALTLAGIVWLIFFAGSGGASGVPIVLAVFLAGSLHAIGSLFKKYYGNA